MIGGRQSSGAVRTAATGSPRSPHEPVRALAVRLVDDEDVGNLHDAGLERLDIVARAGHERHDRDVGRADDVDFVLTDADRFDEHDVFAGGVEHQRRIAGRAGQAAEVSARRHAADEDALVGGVRLHPQAIAEHGAAGERAGGIDRDDPDRLRRRRRSVGRQAIDQRALPGARADR